MASSISRQPGLSAAELKIIAIIAMTGDHLAWAFLPTVSLPAFFLHLLGRTAMPVMCFFIAEGYRHTHSVPRYALRLGFFALVSAVPFSYFDTGTLLGSPFSVLYTLLLGLLAIWACDAIRSPQMCIRDRPLLLSCLPGRGRGRRRAKIAENLTRGAGIWAPRLVFAGRIGYNESVTELTN